MAKKKLRIAQVGTVWESTPPKLYGGTERVVYNLTNELVNRGHDVTLFATGDSKTKAKLVSLVPKPLYRQGIAWENITYPIMHLHQALSKSRDFDIFHIHLNKVSDYLALAIVDICKLPAVFTLHFRLPDLNSPKGDRHVALKYFKEINYVSISDSQRNVKSLNYIKTVYNGIDTSIYKFSKGGKQLSWLGRFMDDKGTKEAILTALSLNLPIDLAGKLDFQDKLSLDYYSKEIEPLMKKHKKLIKYHGEINDQQKNIYFGNSKVLLNPINWEEPFGLVPIEANACGTPVVAFARGSMPELIKDGVNGFLVKPGDVKAMSNAVKRIYNMTEDDYQKLRLSCRKHVEGNFSIEKMTDGYEKAYYKVLNK